MAAFQKDYNRMNYLRNNPLANRKSDYFTNNIRKSMDPTRVSWNSVSKFVDRL